MTTPPRGSPPSGSTVPSPPGIGSTLPGTIAGTGGGPAAPTRPEMAAVRARSAASYSARGSLASDSSGTVAPSGAASASLKLSNKFDNVTCRSVLRDRLTSMVQVGDKVLLV
ncbi:hypothetical protein IFM12275_01780 [Nocardia sputorum]|nr:hypothetical protein IFM12275_01780 [Nocardia sputorum]